jgi:hypothetical protein
VIYLEDIVYPGGYKGKSVNSLKLRKELVGQP